MQLAPGTMVTPALRLVRLLGQGGMGSVWVADHLSLDTQVAVKFIAAASESDRDSALLRFQREAKAAAKIASPHVVHIYDQGIADDQTPYMVMELLRGESLRTRIHRLGALSPAEVATVVAQVAKALAAAHKLGIVHRDIKPDNIFLMATEGDEAFVKLLDFGVAKELSQAEVVAATATGAVVGTPSYLSPEQLIEAKAANTQSDLWSLSVVAYHAVTGQKPFTGDTLVALCLAVSKGKYAPPSELDSKLPQAFDRWFERALARDPNQRFSSVKELASSFELLCETPGARGDPPLDGAKTMVMAESSAPTDPSPAGQSGSSASPGSNIAAGPPPAAPVAPPPVPAQAHAVVAQASAGRAHPTPQPTTGSTGSKAALAAVVALALLLLLGGGWWLRRTLGAPDSDGSRAAPGPGSSPLASVTESATAGHSSSAAQGSALATASVSSEPAGPLVEVPAGEYWLGCLPDKNRECYDDERPGQQLRLPAFAISRTEVTAADYQGCVAAGKCPRPKSGKGCTFERSDAERKPINCVDWNGARVYCEHQGWRLPTEAEWEVAALGKTHEDFPWGPEPASCARSVVASHAGPGCGAGGPQEVGSQPADRSWVGAMDLGGNLREWTATDYQPYPGGKAVAGSRGKVNRGGSFEMEPGQISTGHTRGADPANVTRPDLGFRCAVDRR